MIFYSSFVLVLAGRELIFFIAAYWDYTVASFHPLNCEIGLYDFNYKNWNKAKYVVQHIWSIHASQDKASHKGGSENDAV